MDIDFDKEHEILYSGASLLLGKIHAYLVRADSGWNLENLWSSLICKTFSEPNVIMCL